MPTRLRRASALTVGPFGAPQAYRAYPYAPATTATFERDPARESIDRTYEDGNPSRSSPERVEAYFARLRQLVMADQLRNSQEQARAVQEERERVASRQESEERAKRLEQDRERERAAREHERSERERRRTCLSLGLPRNNY